VHLVERNVLLGGEPGGGKSVGQSMLTATAALDPSCELTLLDGKYVELAPWVGCAARAVGPSQDECVDVLRALVKEMDERYVALLANRQRKVERANGWPLHVVVCDELAFYLNSGNRTGDKEAGNLLRDLVSRGRAAGFVVLAATQKPSGDTIPTFLRDLFAFRWAFRCTTPQMSDTILGGGWATAGFSASGVDAAHRGVGFLLHEGGQPVRLRTFYLADDDLGRLARRAEAVRARMPRRPSSQLLTSGKRNRGVRRDPGELAAGRAGSGRAVAGRQPLSLGLGAVRWRPAPEPPRRADGPGLRPGAAVGRLWAGRAAPLAPCAPAAGPHPLARSVPARCDPHPLVGGGLSGDRPDAGRCGADHRGHQR
jgi:DNA segregation ATPase FtsK/SpoIIIE, S-DNA-T family